MNTSHAATLMLALLFAVAALPSPAGDDVRGCGMPLVMDPGLRASIERFDRHQSPTAAKLCTAFLNSDLIAARLKG
ncbi:MAG TPA: hypothetical protein VHN11_00195 [Xanthobacteraceae bacterium]|jgi:hypothetical protein|nr:hypothetical protein [Xanthobacteraceae bacterium]